MAANKRENFLLAGEYGRESGLVNSTVLATEIHMYRNWLGTPTISDPLTKGVYARAAKASNTPGRG